MNGSDLVAEMENWICPACGKRFPVLFRHQSACGSCGSRMHRIIPGTRLVLIPWQPDDGEEPPRSRRK